jgi:hypothetical protein
LKTFIAETGCDREDSLGDLLADLMHWADIGSFDFDAALLRARDHYLVEKIEEAATPAAAPDLLAALTQAVAALNTAPRFSVPCLGTDSYAIAAICDRAIGKARGGAA